ncbi:tyrosine-tRNA ligase [Heterostelium album PN500]|uniref:Tyrosine--tRNA ligase n=1 Tax=Heterostelium pallidum (strain ATCC 26659 / Pp 5 / PN500) TaxID=670386 RepID=D3BT29_HETP5|nr:tyrosine-tRNA ligase [Heterostelium album PN500]EFA75246.1 tyrosine-tRNA ligase [Heterostelium album PN500]|eukprot:XP_020427380.1 tyrosine-tRNA ligase [Heterostelium album PN500]
MFRLLFNHQQHRTTILNTNRLLFNNNNNSRFYSSYVVAAAATGDNVIKTLRSRGFIYQMTNNDEEMVKITNTSISLYAGFDPTADSLHIGNLLTLMVLLHFKRHGHKPVALLGGATALIGDPSGKSTDRPQLDRSYVENNSSYINENIVDILGKDTTIVNNIDWNKSISIIDFFRDVGRYFRVGNMLRKDFVHNRLGTLSENGKQLSLNDDDSASGISLPEFCYSLFQANDFVHLNQTHQCVIQVGGSDQWGNITDGCELIKKKLSKPAYGITIPLLTNSQGKKLGKSEGNSIWLSSKKTSAYNFYQYWIQVSDQDVEKLLKLFTLLPLEEIQSIVDAHNKEPHLRLGQKKIAECVTQLVHGDRGLEDAIKTTNLLFGDNKLNLQDHSESKEIGRLLSGVNISTSLSKSEYLSTPISSIFSKVSGLSKNQSKLLINNQSLYLNGEQVKSPAQLLEPECLIDNSFVILRSGKKAFHLIKFD